MSQTLNLHEFRRRTRISLAVPVMLTSLENGIKYQAVCDTLDISSNGALLKVRVPLPAGARLRLDVLHSNQVTEVRITRCENEKKTWTIGVQLLQQTGNFWNVKSPPENWEGSRSGDDTHWYG